MTESQPPSPEYEMKTPFERARDYVVNITQQLDNKVHESGGQFDLIDLKAGHRLASNIPNNRDHLQLKISKTIHPHTHIEYSEIEASINPPGKPESSIIMSFDEEQVQFSFFPDANGEHAPSALGIIDKDGNSDFHQLDFGSDDLSGMITYKTLEEIQKDPYLIKTVRAFGLKNSYDVIK